MHIRIIYFVCLSLFLVFLSGCGEKVIQTYHLSLTGESENWKVESYKMDLTPKTLKAGDGIVMRKGEQTFYSDAYAISVYAVIDERHEVIQRNSASSNQPMEMNHLSTGTIEGETYFDQDGNAITLDHIREIYLLIEWEDSSGGNWLEEKVELYRNDEGARSYMIDEWEMVSDAVLPY